MGPYETLGATYDAMNTWLENSPDYVANGGPWELYITDPSAEPDPARWPAARRIRPSHAILTH